MSDPMSAGRAEDRAELAEAERDRFRESAEHFRAAQDRAEKAAAERAAEVDRLRAALAGTTKRLDFKSEAYDLLGARLAEAERVAATLRSSRAEIGTKLNDALRQAEAERDRLAEQVKRARHHIALAIASTFIDTPGGDSIRAASDALDGDQ